MARTPRSPRKTRPRKQTPKRSPLKKREAMVKAGQRPGMVEAALAAFAHEVRTPLTGILAVSDLLATSDLDERERRWIETIKAGAEHLAALATLFVDAARSSGPGLTIRNDFFDLRNLSQNVGDSLAGRAAAKGLRSTVAIAPNLPPFVTGDSIRLRAALENLIDNAVKFTNQGDVSFEVTRKRGLKGKVRIAFAVSDSGIGLTLAEIKRLFRRFSQANVSIASRFGGAGLGLSSVKQLAIAMGGDITVTQRRGGGATFVLSVALVPAPSPVSLDPEDGVGATARTHQPLRILSVEDNPFGRVVPAAERIVQGGFDAVLMDMVLPGISGIEAICQIRALPQPHGSITVIGVSGRDADATAAHAAGADGFLVKPVSPRALATALLAARRPSAAAP